jgi:hypothetical protein
VGLSAIDRIDNHVGGCALIPDRRWEPIVAGNAEYLLVLKRTRTPGGRLRKRVCLRFYRVEPD